MKPILLLLASALAVTTTEPKELQWRSWSDGIFAEAKREHRFVLLDLQAVWCHWCHVMDKTTYQDPTVVALLQSHYITVRVDEDSRPDLASRYEDYGWPATVVYGGDGKEIVKRSGYLPPGQMASMLRAIIADRSPGPSVHPEPTLQAPAQPILPTALRQELMNNYRLQYDPKQGSWGRGQKYLEWNSAEYSLELARKGDKQSERMARVTLTKQLNLLDPAWGGVYQYSTDGDWKHPHFEKIMLMQSQNLRLYSLAYAQWRDPAYLHAAHEIARYLKTFLTSPDGAFYTSQDADLVEGEHSAAYFQLDDAGRRKLGIPRVDKHIYSRENGWAIAALATLYSTTHEKEYLDEAVRAANWIGTNRVLGEGGFRHDAKDAAGPYFIDTLAMGRAFLTLYDATQDATWLERARTSGRFMLANFQSAEDVGFLTARTPADQAYAPHPERDENIEMVRFCNQLYRATNDAEFESAAQSAMRYAATPEIARRFPSAAVLLAELSERR